MTEQYEGQGWASRPYRSVSAAEEAHLDAVEAEQAHTAALVAKFRAALGQAIEAAQALERAGVAAVSYPDGYGDDVDCIIETLEQFQTAEA